MGLHLLTISIKQAKVDFFHIILFTNLSVNQSQSARISFDVRKRVSVLDAYCFNFPLVCEDRWFLLLIFYAIDIAKALNR